jgi:hypothetical protein
VATPRWARLVGLSLVAAVGLRGAPARAQAETTGSAIVSAPATQPARPRVMLLALTSDDPLAARLAAELEALGLEVARAQIDPSVPIEDLVRQAMAGGVRGVVVADGRRTEFWVAEEGSNQIAMRQELEIENSPAMESVLSLRTVEFLRVSLGLAGRPPPVAPPPPITARPAEEPEGDRRVAFSLVSGVVISTGRLPPFAVAGAGVQVRIVGPVGLELRGLAPLMTQQVRSPDGPVDTAVWLGGGGLLFAPRTGGRAAFDAGLGAMAVMMWGSGTGAADMLAGQTDHVVGLALYARAAGRIHLSPSWSVRLDVLGGSTAPRRPIIITAAAGNDVTAWGVAFVAATAGVEWAF